MKLNEFSPGADVISSAITFDIPKEFSHSLAGQWVDMESYYAENKVMKLDIIRKHIHIWRLSFLVLMVALASTSILAQNQSRPNQDNKDDDLIICPVHVVFVEVMICDDAGQDVADLRKDDFDIYENEVKQVIDFWERQKSITNKQLSTHYKIGYYPIKQQLDDTLRRIKVQVTPKGKVKYKVQVVANKEPGKGERQ